MNRTLLYISLAFLVTLVTCKNTTESTSKNRNSSDVNQVEKQTPQEINLHEISPMYDDGNINVLVEIPAGTLEKWEVNKDKGQLELEHIDGKPRIIQYLGYPGNYGMIPGTILPKEMGGDGDPLDVIVLGAPVKRGEVVKCKIIAVLNLLDRGEQDDKLIAVMEGSPMYNANDLQDLKNKYNGSLDIIETWFINYKGPGKMISKGFQNKAKANLILEKSIAAYNKN